MTDRFNSLTQHGYHLHHCENCQTPFWSIHERQTRCSEFPCGKYRYREISPKRALSIDQVRDLFLNFFQAHDHTILHFYPLRCLWRKDVFFTQASIYGFQPHVVQGYQKPPANPLVISQPCVRFNDFNLIGRSPGHLSLFEMMGHHAFNYPSEPQYRERQTILFCLEFLTKELSLQQEELEWKVSTWSGGGSSGPCLEVIYGGLEIATLVFSSSDDILQGLTVPEMIIDTGYGLERMTMVVTGETNLFRLIAPRLFRYLTSFEHVNYSNPITTHYLELCNQLHIQNFEDVTKIIEELARTTNHTIDEIEEKLAAFFAINQIIDFVRCSLMLLREYLIPSNNNQGYYLRMLLRRILDLIQELQIPATLLDLMFLQMQDFLVLEPNFLRYENFIRTICEEETKRYEEVQKRAIGHVQKAMGKDKVFLSEAKLIYLYQSHGIRPSTISRLFPDTKLQKSNKLEDALRSFTLRGPAPPKIKIIYSYLSSTKKLSFAATETVSSFTAKVLSHQDKIIILDRTAFVPELQGFPGDRGSIVIQDRAYRIEKIEQKDDHVLHHLECLPDIICPAGEIVEGHVSRTFHEHAVRLHTLGHFLLEVLHTIHPNENCRLIRMFQKETDGFLHILLLQPINQTELQEKMNEQLADAPTIVSESKKIFDDPLKVFQGELDLRYPSPLISVKDGGFKCLCAAPHILLWNRSEQILIKSVILSQPHEYQIQYSLLQ